MKTTHIEHEPIATSDRLRQISDITNHEPYFYASILRLDTSLLYSLLNRVNASHLPPAHCHLNAVIACTATNIECAKRRNR